MNVGRYNSWSPCEARTTTFQWLALGYFVGRRLTFVAGLFAMDRSCLQNFHDGVEGLNGIDDLD